MTFPEHLRKQALEAVQTKLAVVLAPGQKLVDYKSDPDFLAHTNDAFLKRN